MPTPLTKADKIESAFRQFSSRLKRGGQRFRRMLGWQGGNKELDVYWHASEHLWAAFRPVQNRNWCSFGTDDPATKILLNITCEINPPYEGINRRCAGIFVRDEAGKIYVAHTGKIGGGRAGIGRSGFLKFYRRQGPDTLLWPDGVATDVIVIGQIDSEKLLAHVVHFVREVERFKSAMSGKQKVIPASPEFTFNPEFAGLRKSYHLDQTVESRCDHGLVISTLAEQL